MTEKKGGKMIILGEMARDEAFFSKFVAAINIIIAS